ncbi:hypothetical protein J2S13_001680 [Oikeobacillus pervagus]|uniref:Uncharacterized protein n=1 Tax=Oikeobacillus pervagus TaxID=1325931 RepID=A0AAJ1WJ33_9BACI|nr:hypothetical protein [Oikeobacillus pervagus]MDQ0215280.1 hypothetical protein [Oikeobacillus pervagus]
MKKGFILLLSSFLLIGTPSFIQAEELTEPLEPSPLATENLPIDSLAQQEDSSNLVKTVETVEQPQQLTNDQVLQEENPNSKLPIPLDPSLFADENVEQPQQPADDQALQEGNTELPIPLDPSLIADESQEDPSSVEANSLEKSSEEIADSDVESAQQPTKEMDRIEENLSESVQASEEKAPMMNESLEEEKEKIMPVLSIRLLGLSINILGENKRKNSPFKRSLISFDINESLKVRKDADEKLEGQQTLKDNWGLLGIGIGIPGVGNLQLDLFPAKVVKTKTGTKLSSEGGVLGLRISDAKDRDVFNLNVIAGKGEKSEKSEDYSSQGGLLGLGLSDSKKTKTLDLNVLFGKKVKKDDNEFSTGGLAAIDVKNPAGNAHVGVIESTKQVIGDTTKTRSGVLLADLTDTQIGDAHLGVGEVSTVVSPNHKEVHAGVVLGDIKNSPLGDNHLGVIEYHKKETEDIKTSSGGLVIVDTKDSPIGDVHIGVGEWSTKENKSPSPNPSEPSEEPSQDDNTKPSDNKPDPDDSTKPSDKPSQEGPDQGEKPGQSEKPSNHNPKSEDQTNNGKPSPTSPITPSKPEQPSKPGQKVIDQDKLPGSDIITLPLLSQEGSNIGGQMAESELVELVSEDQNEVANMKSLDKEHSIADFIQELTDAGNKTVLNAQSENDVSQLQEIVDSVNEKMNNSLQLTPASSQVTPSSGSGSGSSGSSVSGGGSGMVACLDYKYLNEVTLSNHVNYVLNELSDQWINAPPIEPPQSPFFLSI